MRDETIAGMLLARLGDDRPGLRSRERTWTWGEVVRESAARASLARALRTADRARDLPHRPALVLGAAQGSGDDQQMMTSYYRSEITGIPEMGLVGRQLYAQSRLTPADVQAAILYDHFTPLVLPQLEELGFCPKGEGKDFVADGNLDLGGRLPFNTHGGQLGEAYIHGMNGIAEAVRLVRGTSVNQPGDVHNVLVTAGTGVPTSGLILGAAI